VHQAAQIFVATLPHAFSYPQQILMPSAGNQGHLGQVVGNTHILIPEDWAHLPKPAELNGVQWPPTTPQDILTVPRDSSEHCIGCWGKKCKAEAKMMDEFCAQLQPSDMITFDLPQHGRVDGYVQQVVTNMQRLLVQQRPTSGRQIWIPFSAALASDYWYDNVFEGRKPEDIGNGPCNCSGLPHWRTTQADWHKLFEIRATQDMNDVYVVTTKYTQFNRPLGELIGVLKPDLTFWRQQSPATPRSQADLVRHRRNIVIGWRNERRLRQDGGTVRNIECLVDNHKYGNWTRFIRHSCSPNAEWQECRYGDTRMYVLVSLRVIAAEEEIRINHGVSWRLANGGCNCGATNCRGSQIP
jgi:hypothetical protein